MLSSVERAGTDIRLLPQWQHRRGLLSIVRGSVTGRLRFRLGIGGNYTPKELTLQRFLCPIVSKSAYPGGTTPSANKIFIGGLRTYFCSQMYEPMFHSTEPQRRDQSIIAAGAFWRFLLKRFLRIISRRDTALVAALSLPPKWYGYRTPPRA
jgi:hypothetical protein